MDRHNALTDVRMIFPNIGAFAALKGDGSVVTWGYSGWGGTLGLDVLTRW